MARIFTTLHLFLHFTLYDEDASPVIGNNELRYSILQTAEGDVQYKL